MDRQKEDALERLRALLPGGSTIHAVCVHVARGNASAVFRTYVLTYNARTEQIEHHWLDGLIASAGLAKHDRKREGTRVGGTGHNRVDWLAEVLSRALHGKAGAIGWVRL